MNTLKSIGALFTIVYLFTAAFATAVVQMGFIEELLAKLTSVRVGAYTVAGITRQQFLERLKFAKLLLRFDIKSFYNRNLFRSVAYAEESLHLDNSIGTLRKQPYCVVLTGFPGTGKSAVAIRLAAHFLRKRYGFVLPEQIVILNESDAYQSEFRTNHRVVIFDDIDAEKVGLPTALNPWRKIIDFVNNIRKTALNPNVEMKGNVYIDVDLVILTTNRRVDRFSIGSYMSCGSAIFRRFSSVWTVLPGFTHIMSHIMDSAHIPESMQSYSYDEGLVFKPFERMTITTMIEQEVQNAQAHLTSQALFVDSINSHFDDNMIEAKVGPLRALFEKKLISFEEEKALAWHNKLIRWFLLTPRVKAVAMSASKPTKISCDAFFNEHAEMVAKDYLTNYGQYLHLIRDYVLANCDKSLFNMLILSLRKPLHNFFIQIYKGCFVLGDGLEMRNHWFFGPNLVQLSQGDRPHMLPIPLIVVWQILDCFSVFVPHSDVIFHQCLHSNYRDHFGKFFIENIESRTKSYNMTIASWDAGQLLVDIFNPVIMKFLKIARKLDWQVSSIERLWYNLTPDVILKGFDINLLIEFKNVNRKLSYDDVQKYCMATVDNGVHNEYIFIVFSYSEYLVFMSTPDYTKLCVVKNLLHSVVTALRNPSKKMGRCNEDETQVVAVPPDNS